MNEVLRFINVFTSSNNNQCMMDVFSKKCSYWFASILFRRFIRNNAKIMVDIQNKQFGTYINGRIYTISGDSTKGHKWVPWLEVNGEMKDAITKELIMF